MQEAGKEIDRYDGPVVSSSGTIKSNWQLESLLVPEICKDLGITNTITFH